MRGKQCEPAPGSHTNVPAQDKWQMTDVPAVSLARRVQPQAAVGWEIGCKSIPRGMGNETWTPAMERETFTMKSHLSIGRLLKLLGK